MGGACPLPNADGWFLLELIPWLLVSWQRAPPAKTASLHGLRKSTGSNVTRPAYDDPGRGTPGDALCTWGVLRTSRESRRVEVLPDGDVIAHRLMDSVELWHPTTQPLRDGTVLRLVRSARSLAALLVPPAVAPTSHGVALATSSADGVGVPAASSPGSQPDTVPHGRRPPAHDANRGTHSDGEGGEPVRGFS